MIRSRALPVFLAVAAFSACSPDKRTGPDNPLASELAAIADSAERGDFRVAAALYSASAMVRAGGQVGTVSIVVDSQPRTFNAIGMRVSYSPAACEQLRSLWNEDGLMIADSSREQSDSGLFMPYDPCAPHQSLVAWEGEDLARIVVLQGDTGTNSISPNSYDFNFFAELYDRTTDTEWMLIGGTSSNGMVSRGSACRETGREQGVKFNCRLVTLSQSFDLVLQEWPRFDLDSAIMPIGRAAARPLSTLDTVVFDTTDYGWEMGPTHTLAMRRHVINGLAMEITSFDFERGFGRSMAGGVTSARIRRSRSR